MYFKSKEFTFIESIRFNKYAEQQQQYPLPYTEKL